MDSVYRIKMLFQGYVIKKNLLHLAHLIMNCLLIRYSILNNFFKRYHMTNFIYSENKLQCAFYIHKGDIPKITVLPVGVGRLWGVGRRKRYECLQGIQPDNFWPRWPIFLLATVTIKQHCYLTNTVKANTEISPSGTCFYSSTQTDISKLGIFFIFTILIFALKFHTCKLKRHLSLACSHHK